MKAIVIAAFGGPAALALTDVPTPVPQADQVLVRNRAIGVNFVDVQHRAGAPYPVTAPLIPGIEAAGVVEALGSDVTDFKVGDRVGVAGHMGGVYAECCLAPQDRLIPLPASIDFGTAAAVLMQGTTAHALAHSAYAIQPGETVLVHSAGSGVGFYLAQMARKAGAMVIATVSSAGHANLARHSGAEHVIVRGEADFEAETKRLTHGRGAHAVYDAIGRDTFDQNIRSLRAKGHLVMYGLSSGAVPPFDINRLSGITGSGNHGSLYLTWATLGDHAACRDDLLWHAREVLKWVGDKSLTLQPMQTLPLAQAARAHELIESRQAAAKIVLLPYP